MHATSSTDASGTDRKLLLTEATVGRRGGIDRLFIQMPYRLYCNVATPVADHLDPEFYAQVKHNAKRQLDRFGDFDKAFETMYDVASL